MGSKGGGQVRGVRRMSECGLLANEDAGALLSHDRIDAPPQSRNGLIDILKFDTHLYSAYIYVTSSKLPLCAFLNHGNAQRCLVV